MIKDCTHTQNLRPTDRIKEFFRKIGPQSAIKRDKAQAVQDKFLLAKYKQMLKQQFEIEGESAAERLSVDEIVENAEKRRFKEVIDANIGKEVTKPPVKMIIPGSSIPKVKYSGNRPR